ncbi:MAG: FHA domain-containing protein [Gammaproteobacteria bacterium]
MSTSDASQRDAEYDRTHEFQVDDLRLDTGARTVLCALLSPRQQPGVPVRITTPANVVLEAWEAVSKPLAEAAWVRNNRLLAVFDSPDTALPVARQLVENLVFPDELCARLGLHVGVVDCVDGEYRGEALGLVEHLTRLASPGWIVATRPVYDRLAYSDQLNLYSLDHVAFGPDQAPFELLKVAEDSDYLRSTATRPPWGPYRRMVARWGTDTEIVLEADSKPLTIGRGRGNRLRTDDAFVSVEHARIVYRDREFLLLDSSTNGTFCAARGEPHFKVPPMLRLRKPGTLWFGRPPSDAEGHSLSFYFD